MDVTPSATANATRTASRGGSFPAANREARVSPALIAGEPLCTRKLPGGLTSSGLVFSRLFERVMPLGVEPWSCMASPLVTLLPTVIVPLKP